MKKMITIEFVLALGMIPKAVNADFTFGMPTEVSNVNSSAEESHASISADGLSLYFISNRSGGVGGRDIWVTTRETTDDDWAEPTNLGPTINTPAGEWGVSISCDGLSLYFDTSQNGSTAVDDLWVATRATTDDDWGNPVSLGPTVNSSADDYTPSISSDDLSLYFTSGPARGGYGNYDLWVTTRATKDDPWGAPENLGPTVNSSAYELNPSISFDGLILFFTIGMTNCGSRCGYGNQEIWVTRRATTDDPWGEPVNLGSTINSPAWEAYPNVSNDGSTLLFRYGLDGRSGGDIWQAPIVPMVDFNGDGQVDGVEVCTMVDRWGTDDPLCDIGPMPWGDGIVDVQDLVVLAEYIGEKMEDPTLAAHWVLDETEGLTAHDSLTANDGTVMGDAVWRPDAGMVDGALEFDGVDDFVATDLILDPEDGPFSLFVWIKGGAAGQVIVSQADARLGRFDHPGCSWLAIDPVLGTLTTGLASSGFISLASEVVITDGQWHRVGLVWDMSSDISVLYVDEVEVAADVHPTLPRTYGGLQIGAGRSLEPGTFFTGLIDDVRIYNRAVQP